VVGQLQSLPESATLHQLGQYGASWITLQRCGDLVRRSS